MYFAIGWPQTLTGCDEVKSIVPNSDHSIFLFLADESIALWYCRPVVQLLKYRRRPDSLEQYGQNVAAVWKSDSSQIVVQTTSDYLLFYNLVYAEDSNSVLNLNESRKSDLPSEPTIPALVLELHTQVHIRDGISCLMAAVEAVVIATKTFKNGVELCGIEWEGKIDPNFHLSVSVPHSKSTSKAPTEIVVTDIKFSTIIGGFSLVLSNNVGGFLPLGDGTNGYQLQLITGVDSPRCTAINHKYALIAYGLQSSEGVLCQYDEIDNRFVLTHHLTLPSDSHGDMIKSLGAMNCIQWSPDLTMLVTSWENGGFALWTVFGSLLSCSLTWNSYSMDKFSCISPFVVSSIAFGKEGYHLYLATRLANNFTNEYEYDTQDQFNTVYKLSLARSVLAANPSSSVTAETVLLASEDKLYVGGNKNLSLFTQYTADEKESLPNGLTNLILSEQESNVDSFQWLTVPIPNAYLDTNWPVRFFAIDPVASQNLAVSGSNGFAVYSLLSRKWKLFNNENHERDFVVTGGFLWYHQHLICGCFNQTKSNSYEIRAYSTRNRLDNAFAKVISVENEINSLSLHRNRLLALCANGSIFFYDIHQFHRPGNQESELSISAPIRVVMSNFHIIPDCVTMCLLTDLHVDMYHSVITSDAFNHHRRGQAIQIAAVAKSLSILLNIFGKVYLCEIDIDTTALPLSSEDEEDDEDVLQEHDRTSLSSLDSIVADRLMNATPSPAAVIAEKARQRTKDMSTEPINLIKYKKTTILASNVESLWILPHEQTQLNAFRSGTTTSSNVQLKPHLETSLYLNCGAQGMAVWLSLEHSIRKGAKVSASSSSFQLSSENEHAYISKRIMLPLNEISSHIYPLAVRFRDVIVLGAESDFTNHCPRVSAGPESLHSLPFCVIKRTSQVYLHYILRELLRRNLGYRAWEIANTCTALPHFVHSLELLLHGVLEEEAGSSAVIPDPLLPRVVEFIRAFPVFLQTVIHCARKTELALWPHLFSVVGSPKDLFHQCITAGQLETASSYIIVLQNLEKPEVATKCAAKLLQAARIAGSWATVKELKRFLRATQEQESQQQHLKARTESVSSSATDSAVQNLSDDSVSIARDNSPEKALPETFSRSNSADQYKPPGGALKQEESHVEEDIVMKADDSSSRSDQEEISMEDLASMEPIVVSDKILEMDKILCEPSQLAPPELVSPGSLAPRAYPGSIKLMTSHDAGHFSGAPFQFLATHAQGSLLGTCSISSINSISSVASSMSYSNSSTSSSPAVRTQSDRDLQYPVHSNGPTMLSKSPPAAPLKSGVSRPNGMSEENAASDENQCVIS